MKETKSFKVDPGVWHKFKVRCAELDIDISEKLEELINKELGKVKK